MSLGVELGLGLGDFVLDGDLVPPSPKGGGAPPQKKKNWPMFIVAKHLDG